MSTFQVTDGELHDILVAERKAVKKAVSGKVAEDICKIIDDIELSYRNTSLEEWKAFKHIRNAIRDKYMPKRHSY